MKENENTPSNEAELAPVDSKEGSSMEVIDLLEDENDKMDDGKCSTPSIQSEESPTVTRNDKEENSRKYASNHETSIFALCRPQVGIETGRDLGVWERSLEDRANCISKWFLSYLTPLIRLGSRKVLDADDMGVPSEEDLADEAYAKAVASWERQVAKTRLKNEKIIQAHQAKLAKCKTEEERQKLGEPQLKDPSIGAAIFSSFGYCQLLVGLFYYFISTLLGFVPILILNDLVKFFQSGLPMNEYHGLAPFWVEVVGLGVVPALISILQTRHFVIMSHCAVYVRTAISLMLYRKALRVSAAGRAKTSTGQVVNMMSNDTSQIQRFLQYVGMVLVAPVQIIIALVLIFQQVGNATWVGVGFMIFLIPVNMIVFSIVSTQRRTVMRFSDLRVKTMNEIFNGIRVIKFYAWERPFRREVADIRAHELAALTKLAYTTAIGFSMILMSAPLIQPILVFLTYSSLSTQPLSAAIAFTTVSLFNMIRIPFAFLPMGFLQYIQSCIALRRLERYLDLPELSPYVDSTPPPDAKDESMKQEGSITIRNGHFSWVDPDAKPIRSVNEKPSERRRSSRTRRVSKKTQEATDGPMNVSNHSKASSAVTEASQVGPTITLQDLNFHIEAGSLVAVVGEVGSGKSSFLSAILGEMEPIQGSRVYLPRPANSPSGYVSYCSQSPWVVNDTLRGNVLFGRPYDEERYNQIVEASALVDDIAVLPAGDMTEIGERGINLSGGQKARVSLARALYSSSTKVVLMDDPLSAVDAHVGEHIFANAITGKISKGITRILVTHHVHLLPRCDYVIVLEHGRIAHQGKYSDLVAKGVEFAGAIDVERAKSAPQEDEETMEKQEVEKKEYKKEEKSLAMEKSGKKLMKDEEKAEGSISGSAYMHYAKAGGYFLAIMVLVVQAIGRASEIGSSFWLSNWATQSFNASKDGHPLDRTTTYYYLAIYAVLGFGGVLGLTGRALLIAALRLGASKKLHDGLVGAVLRAPVAFYDVTPTGRILNRFAADMDKIDLELTQSLSQMVQTISNVIGAVGAMVAGTKGTFLAPLIPIGYIYFVLQKWFRKTNTELQRINSIANSPIFADFSQTLTGTSTIRAYGEENRFFEHCKNSFDAQNVSYLLVQLANYWLGLRLDFLGGVMGAFIGAVAVATSGFIPAGWLGLALSYSIDVTSSLKMGVRMMATIEAQMNSVERVLYYTNNITPEAAEDVPEKDPAPGTWPSSGEIEIKNASMRYRDGPLVLKDISLKVKSGEKIGVCGRTGSGKSSLMIVLFRISEIEQDGGTVVIDDVNTGDIGLFPLRSNLSIIPQDPIVFSNTVRYNLDPFKKASDEEIWAVLQKVRMDDVIAALPGGLDELVSEGGENFSQGQRQLLCIGRSLLRKPKVLVLDEATASIDNATDNAIQEMIRENFSDATVLTIAHRLNTIMDSDKVLVLDDGRVAEYDTPQNLLQREDSLFKAMVDRSRAAKSQAISED